MQQVLSHLKSMGAQGAQQPTWVEMFTQEGEFVSHVRVWLCPFYLHCYMSPKKKGV